MDLIPKGHGKMGRNSEMHVSNAYHFNFLSTHIPCVFIHLGRSNQGVGSGVWACEVLPVAPYT